MKKQHHYHTLVRTCLFLLLSAATCEASLTALILFEANSSGDSIQGFWRTSAPGGTANLTTTPLGNFLNNSPSWSINLELASGVNQFYIYGGSAPGQLNSSYGINLYFDGNNLGDAQISGLVEGSTSQSGPHPQHSANSSLNTRYFAAPSFLGPAAGTLSYQDITLTDFWVVKSENSGTYHWPQGGGDNVVAFIELTVGDSNNNPITVPEPASASLIFAALLTTISLRRTRR
jgi:hypothetical protein